MAPLLASVLINAGVNVGGAALSRIIGGPAAKPDYISPAVAEGQNLLKDIQQQETRALDRLEGDAAASGQTGLGSVSAREAIMRTAANSETQARAHISDQMTQARKEQMAAKVAQDNQRKAMVSQMVMGGVQAGLSVYNQSNVAKQQKANTNKMLGIQMARTGMDGAQIDQILNWDGNGSYPGAGGGSDYNGAYVDRSLDSSVSTAAPVDQLMGGGNPAVIDSMQFTQDIVEQSPGYNLAPLGFMGGGIAPGVNAPVSRRPVSPPPTAAAIPAITPVGIGNFATPQTGFRDMAWKVGRDGTAAEFQDMWGGRSSIGQLVGAAVNPYEIERASGQFFNSYNSFNN